MKRMKEIKRKSEEKVKEIAEREKIGRKRSKRHRKAHNEKEKERKKNNARRRATVKVKIEKGKRFRAKCTWVKSDNLKRVVRFTHNTT